MTSLIGDYYRLARAAVSLAQHDVILPGDYQRRMPLPAVLFGRFLRLINGGAKGRPGERLAKALENLGPAYIKLGQFLATRPDVFGVETANDLSRLKDKIPAFGIKEARKALEEEFGEDEAKTLFPPLEAPIAAASLAQVHKVETSDGLRAVKILRPGVETQIENALSAMGRAAKNAQMVSAEARRLEMVAFTDTVGDAMRKELDLRLEAGGTDEMRDRSDDDGFYVIPKVDWQRSGMRVLTTDWVDGVPLTAPNSLEGEYVDRAELANAVTRGFLSHAIKHGVFHADMHEGNMIVTPEGKLALVDFGIIGRIGALERRFLAEILYGFIKRDYHRIAEVHFEAGYVPPNKSVGDFAQALRSVGEPIHGKNAQEVSMGRLLLQLLDYTHTFGMHLRPELVLLQKTMVQVEGVARGIDPTHDIWTAAEPIVESWVKSELGPAGASKLVAENTREITDRLKKLPMIMDAVETTLLNPPPQQPQRGFAPWWGWFGFILGLGALGVWAFG